MKYYLPVLEKLGPHVFIDVEGAGFLKGFYELFGIQDLILVSGGILLMLELRYSDCRIVRNLGYVLFVLFFVWIFPDFSATFEATRARYFEELRGGYLEGINVLYVWLKFPIYWFLGGVIFVLVRYWTFLIGYARGVIKSYSSSLMIG